MPTADSAVHLAWVDIAPVIEPRNAGPEAHVRRVFDLRDHRRGRPGASGLSHPRARGGRRLAGHLAVAALGSGNAARARRHPRARWLVGHAAGPARGRQAVRRAWTLVERGGGAAHRLRDRRGGRAVAHAARGRVTDDRVVRVLEEVRDLQRQLLAAYGQALENQREAIRTQRETTRRARLMLGVVGVILLFVFVMVVVLLRYVLRHY